MVTIYGHLYINGYICFTPSLDGALVGETERQYREGGYFI